MQNILEVLQDTAIDTLKLLPFLFITYLIMEYIEHKTSNKIRETIKKSGRFGPLFGAVVGIFPQCGFSAVAANFYAGKIITRGTLIAIFLSTSDEMLPVLISEGTNIGLILQILAIKVIIGMGLGICIDLLERKQEKDEEKTHIHQICEDENCHCDEEGIVKSSIIHTLQIFAYILVISLIINFIIYGIGEEKIANLVVDVPIVGTLISALIGIIPNCASSIILTELFLGKIITMGQMIAGLLVNSGIGILVLFKVNKNVKENLKILGILYIIGITSGILLDLIA